jgi:hypothetical protein
MTDIPEFQHFPQHMTHPQFRPATLGTSDDARKGIKGMIGTPIKFPPVTVHNQRDLEYHQSQGYEVSGKANPHAFAAAMAVPDNVVPIGHLEYPKMVGGVVVQDEGQEDFRRLQMAAEEIAAAERAKAEADRAAAVEADPDGLRGEVQELRAGLQETRQGVTDMKAMLELLLEQRTAPAATAEAGRAKPAKGGQAA